MCWFPPALVLAVITRRSQADGEDTLLSIVQDKTSCWEANYTQDLVAEHMQVPQAKKREENKILWKLMEAINHIVPGDTISCDMGN